MGGTRQTKGRSRTGCKQCRIDRKKCDENRPTCGRCAARRVECDFDRPLGVRLGNRRRSRSVITSSDPAAGLSDGYPIRSSESPQNPTTMAYHPTSYLRDYTSPEQSIRTDTSPLANALVPVVSAVSASTIRSTPGFIPVRSPTPLEPPGMDVGSVHSVHSVQHQEHQDVEDPFHDLLRDLFGSDVPNMTASMSLMFGPGGTIQTDLELPVEPPLDTPSHHLQTYHSTVEPRDVQRRFNAPLDPRAALLSTISAPVIATLSDIDARLFYHYIDIQATISIAMETDDNPLTKHFVPVALSSALTGKNEDNPAFHALRASAATHRANLMDRTGTDGAHTFRDIAHNGRKTAYALLANNVETLPKATTVEREQFGGALCILVSLAVVDGNARLLPRLFDMYEPCLRKAADLTAHEEFFVTVISFWQTWHNFTLTIVNNQPPIPLLSEALASTPRCPDVDAVFAIAPRLVAEHMQVYKLIRAHRSSRPGDALAAQIEADELITVLEHNLARDLEARELRDGSNPIEQRMAIGRLIHHAALRVLLLREIFQCSRKDYQIQQCVRHGLNVLGGVKWGTEAGLLIPLTILSTAALDHEQRQYRNFMFRLCWKGSAGPRAALETLDMVMENRGLNWKEALVRMGPVILV